MMRFGSWLTLAAGLVALAGCNRKDADVLSRIGQIVVERAKALPELKASPQPPNTAEETKEPRTK